MQRQEKVKIQNKMNSKPRIKFMILLRRLVMIFINMILFHSFYFSSIKISIENNQFSLLVMLFLWVVEKLLRSLKPLEIFRILRCM